jgi:pilus assembly protein CpaE
MAKVLVVDDNTDLLETIRQILEQRGGYQTMVSTDGMDGLNKALADPPDLAIVDVMMPGISGHEVCRQLRANPATASIPIIVLTARGQLMDRQAALDAGADDYIIKPVTMKELLERVTQALVKRDAGTAPVVAGTIVLLSMRGGVGTTTLAVNLAAVLAQTGDGAACLVDLCPSSGHVALQLGLRPEPNWSDFVRAGIPDAAAIEARLLRHDSGLHVLASPLFPVVGPGLSRAVVQTVLRTLEQRFATTVVDAPPVLSEGAMTALEAATAVGLVVTAEAPSIQAAVGTLRALRGWSDRTWIILNQVSPGTHLSTEAVERTLRRPLLGSVPFDADQARGLAQGQPAVLHRPTSPLAQAIEKLTQSLARNMAGAAAGR